MSSAVQTPLGLDYRITTLDSGLRVVSEHVPSVRSVALGFFIDTGSAAESENEAGLSHLLEHMLFRGTGPHSSEELNQIFDGMGADINASTDQEHTVLYVRSLDTHLPEALGLMSGMIWRPRFDDLETERQVVLEEIAMYEDDPQDRASELSELAIFGSHPLGRPVIGTSDVVGAVSRKQLLAFHAERYQPENIVVSAAGSLAHDALVEMASESWAQGRVYGDLSKGKFEVEQSPLDFQARTSFLQKETEQYHVFLGGRGLARDDERRFVLRVLNNIFGGTTSSRLNQEIRERRGLAYSVFSFSRFFTQAGALGLYLGTRPENLEEAMAVIADELRRCVADPATEAELVRSRENLKGRMVLAMESTPARMTRLGECVLTGSPIMSIDEMMAKIDAVSIADLKELAEELFVPERLSVAAVGPDEAVFDAAIVPLRNSA